MPAGPSNYTSPEVSKGLNGISTSSGDRGTPPPSSQLRPSVSRGGSSGYHHQSSMDSRHSPLTPHSLALTPISPSGSLPTVHEVPPVQSPSFANRFLAVMGGGRVPTPSPSSFSPPSSPMGARAPFSSPLMSEGKKKSKGILHKLRKTAKKTLEGLKRMVRDIMVEICWE